MPDEEGEKTNMSVCKQQKQKAALSKRHSQFHRARDFTEMAAHVRSDSGLLIA